MARAARRRDAARKHPDPEICGDGRALDERTAFSHPELTVSLKSLRTGADGLRRDEVGTLLSEVEAEEVDWLWRSWLPLGKLVVVDGDPGLGKSAMTMDIAGRVSSGTGFPDG